MFNQPCDHIATSPCRQYYYCDTDDYCYHEGIWPVQAGKLFGLVCMSLCGGLSSAGGLGGGGLMLPFLTLYLHYMPKQSTVVIFIAILGAQTGNLLQQLITNPQVIRTRLAFLIAPAMTGAALIGVMSNIVFPAIFIILVCLIVSGNQLKKIYKKAVDLYQIQQASLESMLDKPPAQQDNFQPRFFVLMGLVYIGVYVLLSIKGSVTYPSWVGLGYCGVGYWLLTVSIASSLIYSAYWISSKDQIFHADYKTILAYSSLSGIYSGWGLGGGLFLNRLCQELKMDPLQSSSTVSLCIFMTASINSLQCLMSGVITTRQFIELYLAVALGSYLVSRVVSNYVKNNNRYSYLQFLLIFLVSFSMISLPYSALTKWRMSGYESSVLFGFKSPC